MLFSLLELVESLLETLVGLLKAMLHGEIEARFKALVERKFGDVLHASNIRFDSFDHGNL